MSNKINQGRIVRKGWSVEANRLFRIYKEVSYKLNKWDLTLIKS